MEELKSHMEFLGYETEDVDEKTFRAKHTHWFNVRVRDFGAGTLVQAFFGMIGAMSDRCEFANDLNRKAMALRFVVNEEGDFYMEAFYANPYQKTSFSNFLESFNRDSGLAIEHPRGREFLG